MGKFFKNLLLFVLIVLGSYPVLIFISGRLDSHSTNLGYKIGSSGHMHTRIREAKLVKDIDILFLGSSHSYRGFDPRNFKGKKTFNLGSSAQTPIQTQVLLKRYLDGLNPKLIIYTVSPDDFEGDGVESALDIISNDRNDLLSTRMAFEMGNIKIFNTLIYAGITDFFNLNADFVEPVKSGVDTYIKGGYVETTYEGNKADSYPRQEWQFRDEQLRKFNRNLEMFKQRGVKTILVYPPVISRLYNSYTNNNYVDSIFKSTGYEYYNFNPIMQLDDSLHFFDATHLNNRGVDLFNRKLIETLGL